jgi:hypothetical protein
MELAELPGAFALQSDAPWWADVLVVGVIGVIAWGIGWTIASRERKFHGPALTGTAQVLSVKTHGAVGNYPARAICRIRLRVALPGREPYDATAKQNFLPWVLDHIQPGRTVAVQVDSTNPQNVRIDLSQPVSQWQVQSPGAPPEVAAQLGVS